MNPKLEKKLYDKYDFFDVYSNGKKSEIISHIGLECNDGWYGIIKTMCSEIQKIIEKQFPDGYKFHIVQIKEKFGTLRVYTSGHPFQVDEPITWAEMQSERTCEICGNKGKMRTKNMWMMLRCDACWDEENKSE